jgi:hypothetical protein
MPGGRDPSWAQGHDNRVQIGHHVFLAQRDPGATSPTPLPAPAPLAAQNGGSWLHPAQAAQAPQAPGGNPVTNLFNSAGNLFNQGAGFVEQQAGQLASNLPKPDTAAIARALLSSTAGRSAILNPMIGHIGSPLSGTIYDNPNKYGATPEERAYNAARRQALATGGPLPARPSTATAVATALSTSPPVSSAPRQMIGPGLSAPQSRDNTASGGQAGGGGQYITGSSTGRQYEVGKVYSNGNGSYMATANGFQRL